MRVAPGTADENVLIEVVERLLASCVVQGRERVILGCPTAQAGNRGPATDGLLQVIGEFIEKQ